MQNSMHVVGHNDSNRTPQVLFLLAMPQAVDNNILIHPPREQIDPFDDRKRQKIQSVLVEYFVAHLSFVFIRIHLP